MRYRLRTLLILLAIGPPVLAIGWSEYAKYQERERQRQEVDRMLQELEKLEKVITPSSYPQPPNW